MEKKNKKKKIKLYIVLSGNQEDNGNFKESIIEGIKDVKVKIQKEFEDKYDIVAKYCDNIEKESFISKTINRFLADIVVYRINKKDEDEEKQKRVLIKEINQTLKIKHTKRLLSNRIQKVFLYTPYEDIKKDINEGTEISKRKYGDECDKYEVIPPTKPDTIIDIIKISITNLIQKKKVSLFVSCSSNSDDIKQRKDKIIETIGKLNVDYAQKREDKHIDIIGYNDPESREEVFHDYIKKNADIVVFLIDELNDAKQEKKLIDEINFATDTNKEQGSPHVFIYTNRIKQELSKNLENVVNNNKFHFERINDKEDLSKKIQDNIEEYFSKYSIFNKIRSFYKQIKNIKIGAIVIFVFIVILVFYLYLTVWNQNRLLLVGGGSAKNYIKEECEMDAISEKPKYWIYAPMPSSNSWTLLTEEAMKDDKDRKYYPICLSAEEAKVTNFLGNMELTAFKKKGVVVSLLIGYDTLKAYCNASYINRKFLDDMIKQSCSELKCDNRDSITSPFFDSIFRINTIRCDTLNALLQRDTNIKLYATSLGSGTRDTYIDSNKANLQFLTKKIAPNNHTIELYTDISTIDSNRNFIVLGSRYYKPSHGISKAKVLTVLDTNGNPIIKPIYLYFIAYNKSDKGYEVKSEIEQFFKKIKRPIGKDVKERLNKIIHDTNSFIVKDTLLGNTK